MPMLNETFELFFRKILFSVNFSTPLGNEIFFPNGIMISWKENKMEMPQYYLSSESTSTNETFSSLFSEFPLLYLASRVALV